MGAPDRYKSTAMTIAGTFLVVSACFFAAAAGVDALNAVDPLRAAQNAIDPLHAAPAVSPTPKLFAACVLIGLAAIINRLERISRRLDGELGKKVVSDDHVSR